VPEKAPHSKAAWPPKCNQTWPNMTELARPLGIRNRASSACCLVAQANGIFQFTGLHVLEVRAASGVAKELACEENLAR